MRTNARNIGDFSPLPDEVIFKIMAPYLDLQSLKNFKAGCYFFSKKPKLNKLINKELFDLAITDNHLYILNNFNTYTMSSLIKSPQILSLPNKRRIEKVFTAPSYAILLDDNGNCFAHGKDFPFTLEINEYYALHPTFIPLNETIKKVVATKKFAVFITGKEYCYVLGLKKEGEFLIPTTPTIDSKQAEKIYLTHHKPIIDIKANESKIFMLDSDGNWHLSQKDILLQQFSLPEPVFFPNGNKITDIVISYPETFFQNKENKWFDDYYMPLIYTPDTVFNQKMITKIIPGDRVIFLKTHQNKWYRMRYPHDYFGPHAAVSYPWDLCEWLKIENNPTSFELPNQQKIVKIVPGAGCSFFLDDKNNWHGYGSKLYYDYQINDVDLTHKIKPIDFKNILKNCHKKDDRKKFKM